MPACKIASLTHSVEWRIGIVLVNTRVKCRVLSAWVYQDGVYVYVWMAGMGRCWGLSIYHCIIVYMLLDEDCIRRVL